MRLLPLRNCDACPHFWGFAYTTPEGQENHLEETGEVLTGRCKVQNGRAITGYTQFEDEFPTWCELEEAFWDVEPI